MMQFAEQFPDLQIVVPRVRQLNPACWNSEIAGYTKKPTEFTIKPTEFTMEPISFLR